MILFIRKKLWNIIAMSYPLFLRSVYGMNVDKTAVISYKAKLDKSINPKGIYIGKYTWILAGAVILAHDHSRALKTKTLIGNNCVIGVNAIIMPGVIIGDHVIVGSGSVVTKNIEDHCIVVGNPARVVKEGINVNEKGQFIS